MLDIRFIRENPDTVKKGIKNKGVEVDVDRLLALDEERRKLLQEVEGLRAEQNKATEEIAKEGDKNKREKRVEEMKKLKESLRGGEEELGRVSSEFEKLLLAVPNLPLASVPIGKDESDNRVLREEGKKPEFDFEPNDYLKIAENLDLIDIERAAKVSGSRFGYIKKELALLEFTLVKLAFEETTKEGFMPIVPPVLINEDSMRGMGYMERGEEEIYRIEKDNLYLVGTSEQAIGPMHSGEVFNERDLPKRYVAFSPCFRREAGSYGKDTKGILRVHQFDKVEMFSFTKPEDSQKEHEHFLEIEERLMRLLKIPYRVVQICTGDLGDPAAAKYDIEAWMPGQNTYRETHSTSNTTDFQARRLNIRFKRQAADGKRSAEFVHMLNGTAFAIGRTLTAIIENYQRRDGSIDVPEVLQKHVGFSQIPHS